MKRPLAVFPAVLFTLAAFIAVPGDCLFAQTNFVKYAGNPILPLGNPGEWDDAGAAYAHVSFDGTTHHLWYSGSPQQFTYRLGYASSPDGVNWNKHANNPVLSPSSGFDNVDTWLPMVLFDGSAYKMWYTGSSGVGAIGYATAADPVSWTKHTGNPVIAPGSGAWEQNSALVPIVIRTDTLYHIWYSGQSANIRFQSGYATSTDGLSWSKHSGNPVLPVGAPGEWDAVAAIAGSVIFADGQFQMWYHGTTGDPYSNWKIGYATSPDGVNWTKHSGNPILQPGGGWDAEVAGFPRVIKDGHRYRLWYTGRRLNSAVRLGYAEDFSNAAHVDSVRVSREIGIAGSHTTFFTAYMANPHSENLTARALIKNDDGSIIASVDLEPRSTNRWRGEWALPAEPDDYTVGVELNNISAGYLHNSYDWGVFDEFRSNALSHTFTQTAHIDVGASGQGVTVAPDGTVFLANGGDGLRAYRYDGTSFTNTAHINEGGVDAIARGVAVAHGDGTVFLANGGDGLRAYRYDGTSFTNTAHIDDGSDDAQASGVAIATDGTVFLANDRDGLRAYRYDGTSFTNTAHIDDGGYAINVAVAPNDSTVFLANAGDGLRVYRYDGNSFTNTAHDGAGAIDVALAADGTIFAVGPADALRAYSYNGTALVKITQTEDIGFYPTALASASGGTVFLSIGYGDVLSRDTGLWAYAYV